MLVDLVDRPKAHLRGTHSTVNGRMVVTLFGLSNGVVSGAWHCGGWVGV